MVGVAGKSQACHDCRRRRVKCDLRRPACLRCTKANIKCGGYEKNLVFVNRTPENVSLTAVSVLSDLKFQNSRSEPLVTHSAEPELETVIQDLVESSKNGINFRRRAVDLIKRLYLPREPNTEYHLKHTAYSWIYGAADLSGPSQALDVALLAFAMSLLYVTGSGNATLGQGLQLYNTAITHLCTDLENPDTKACDETLATIIVLSTCEIFLCPQDTGWRAHAGGISELLRLRNSKAAMTSSSMWHHLVSRLRTICVLDGLTNRRATFLSVIEWNQIASVKFSNDFFEVLMEMIADVPVLLEEADLLSSTPRKDVLLQWGSNLIRSFATALVRLYFWNEDLRVSSETPLYTAVPSTVCNPADTSPSDKVFPFSLEFAGLNKVILLTFGWSVMLQCLDAIDQLYTLMQNNLEKVPSMHDIMDDEDCTSVTWSAHQQGLSESIAMHQYQLPVQALRSSPSDAKWPSIEFVRSEANRLARFICQSMEYSHKTELGMLACQCTTYPTWAARQHFRQHGLERELAWTGEIQNMTGPSFRTGLRMMKFADRPGVQKPVSRVPSSSGE
ncbi:hypothetical protein NA57DRAFT_80565 [Rhizodiscina lignyota]|uniref:Zn(2)-C6 fungal-type domain-containing protein n=1 Tax=Rhizodiscina lignyota TaxID=1504668 RepID=A0A9P4I745_9PEZI|nr:hypothetical protein NA57DRAFT_80565 [Rhizodiscina lignyota]